MRNPKKNAAINKNNAVGKMFDILELNKRKIKWDEEKTSKREEDAIKKIVDKHEDVPKLQKERKKYSTRVNNESNGKVSNLIESNIFNYDYEPKNKNEIKPKNIILNIDVSKIDSLTINIL